MLGYCMLFVNPLTEPEIETLADAYKYHPLSWTRVRAQSILLSSQGYRLKEISSICNVCRQTVSSAIHDWENIGLLGLIDEYRSGRPKMLTEAQENIVIEAVIESPRSLKKVLSDLSKNFEIDLTLSTLKRMCKAAGMSWKRVRKSLRNARNEEDYERSKCLINELINSYRSNEINVFYFDESGFSLTPSVPYAWQKLGEHIEIPTSRSETFNVLGFVDRDCNFESFVFTGSITTDVVISCFNDFAKKMESSEKPTIVLVDNAPIHTSNKFDQMSVEWCKKGLIVVPISKYSPELNLIEIVWRKIKYEWMPFSAYESLKTLRQELFSILSSIGTEYTINFC